MAIFGTGEYILSFLFREFPNKPVSTFRRACENRDGYSFGGSWIPKRWLNSRNYEVFCSGMELQDFQTCGDSQGLLWYILEKVQTIRESIEHDEGTIAAYLGIING